VTHELSFINGFRALAAFWVLTAHCMIWGGWYGLPVPNPKIAVDVFMIISGYLMALNANARESVEPFGKPFTWCLFWVRRFFRLAPAYYLALFCVVCFSEYFLKGYSVLRDTNPQFWLNDSTYDPNNIHFTIENILLHISFVFGVLPEYSFSTFLPDWSLSLGMQFYFVFPFIYLAMRRFGSLQVATILTIISLIIVYGINKIMKFPEPSLLFMKLPYFLLGMLLYEIGFKSEISRIKKRLYIALSLVISVYQIRSYGKDVLILPMIAIAILVVQNSKIKWSSVVFLRTVLGSKIARLGSDASYAVYLFHGFFISLSGLIISRFPFLLDIPPAYRVGLVWLFVTFCSYTLAILVFHWVEQPGIQLGKKFVQWLRAQKTKRNAVAVSNVETGSLKFKSIKAVLWSGLDIFMRQGVQFVVGVTLARLLTPEEFGIIALLYLFTGIANVFIDGGFSSALVKNQAATLVDESTVFWINLAMGLFAALTLWFSAPWIAGFFGYPILVPLTAILAVSLILNALGGVHLVLFSKSLNFKKPMMISATAAVISGSVAIALALKGFGVWALAWQVLISSLVSTLLLWVFSPWRPAFVFSLDSARSLFRFGSYLMFSALLDIAYTRSYSLLIGKFYGVRELAFYNRADNTKQIPVNVLSMTLSRVAFPIFSAAAHDKKKLRRGVRLAVRGLMLVNLPMMFGLMATAETVIHALFGEKWLPAVPALQVLCIAGMFWPLHVINLNVLKAQGHSNLFFRLEVIKKIVGTVFLLCGSLYGVLGIAWSQAVFGVVGFLINAHYTKKYLDYGAGKQTKDFLAIFMLSMLMAIVVHEIGVSTALGLYETLTWQVASGATLFLGLAMLARIQAISELKQLVRRKQYAA